MIVLPKVLGVDQVSGGPIDEWGGYYIQDKDVTISDTISLDETNSSYDYIYDIGVLSNWADFYAIYAICDTVGTLSAGSMELAYSPPYLIPFSKYYPQPSTLPEEPDMSMNASWDVQDEIIGVAIRGSEVGINVVASVAHDYMGGPVGTLSVNFVIKVKKILYLRGGEEFPNYT